MLVINTSTSYHTIFHFSNISLAHNFVSAIKFIYITPYYVFFKYRSNVVVFFKSKLALEIDNKLV